MEQLLNVVESLVEAVDVPLGGDVVVVHEKFDHGVKTHWFASFFGHRHLPGVRIVKRQRWGGTRGFRGSGNFQSDSGSYTRPGLKLRLIAD